MPENIKPQLLEFLQPGPAELSILVVESLYYLPQLRRMFPQAHIYAVAAGDSRILRPDLEPDMDFQALGVEFRELDYMSERLPYPRASFDYIIGDLTLEGVGNPQDIAAGFSTYIKETGAWLTSFRNIRHWSVLAALRDGHYYHVATRLYARPEFERLLYASYYKNVRLRPQRRPEPEPEHGLVRSLQALGFANRHDDMDVEFWLVRADRSMPELALLKSMYTADVRRRLSRLLHRIEYDVDSGAQVPAFWDFWRETGLFADYVAAFARETVFHPEAFYRRLLAYSHGEGQCDIVRQMLGAAAQAANRPEERALYERLLAAGTAEKRNDG